MGCGGAGCAGGIDGGGDVTMCLCSHGMAKTSLPGPVPWRPHGRDPAGRSRAVQRVRIMRHASVNLMSGSPSMRDRDRARGCVVVDAAEGRSWRVAAPARYRNRR